MARRAWNVAVVGATGTVGSEVLALLDERRLPLARLLPIASDESIGTDVEVQGEVIAVEAGEPALRGFDLCFLCAPPAASLEWARRALHAEVPCIDLSGALAGREDTPLVVTALGVAPEILAHPLLTTPPGPAIAWSLVLAPLAAAAGLKRVVGTSVEAVSGAGRAGIEALSAETLAIFNQQDLPEPAVFGRTVAFDCLPSVGEVEEHGETTHEQALVDALRRLVAPDLDLVATALRLPAFSGDGASLWIQTERPLTPLDACAVLEKAPGVELWRRSEAGPSLRAAVGGDEVLVGRVRPDPRRDDALQLWLAADAVRLAALNAVELAEERLAAS